MLYGMTPGEIALENLIEGNKRFARGELESFEGAPIPDVQEPDAIIVSCSDSRVPLEIIFDKGFGKLFVVRVAGNVIGDLEYESIAFAVQALKSPLVMVLGHQNCGAVKAVLTDEKNAFKDMPAIAQLILPATEEARKLPKDQQLKGAVELNARLEAEKLSKKELIASKIERKDLLVVSAYFDFTTKKISLLSQEEIIK